MRMMLHTFRKDIRRLWPAALAVWVMLAALAGADHWRALSEEIAGEGYLTLLTTMAWACNTRSSGRGASPNRSKSGCQKRH